MELKDFTPGLRVELSPATDAWMMGDRFGTVEPVKGRKYVSVRMDRSGKVRKVTPDLLTIVPRTTQERTAWIESLDVTPAGNSDKLDNDNRPLKLRSTRYTGTRTPQTAEQPNARAKRRVKRSHGVQDISRMMVRP